MVGVWQDLYFSNQTVPFSSFFFSSFLVMVFVVIIVALVVVLFLF